MHIRTTRFMVWALALSLLLSTCAFAGAEQPAALSFVDEAGVSHAYRLLLPDGYEGASRSYPTVYFLPPDGYSAQRYMDDDVPGALKALMAGAGVSDMVVVFPEFAAGDDVYAVTQALIAHIEGAYRVLPGAKGRAAAGTGAGGYLALLLTYVEGGAVRTEPGLFAAAVSHEGLFAGEDNPWLAQYGDLYAALGADASVAATLYTYLDGSTEGDAAYAPGGTNDLCALFRGVRAISNNYDAFEYSLLTDAQYGGYVNALGRSMNRLSRFFAAQAYSASFAVDKHAISSDVTAIGVDYTLTADGEALAALAGGEAFPAVVSAVMTDPATGEELQRVSQSHDALGDITGALTLDPALMAPGGSTAVSVYVDTLGYVQLIGGDTLVRVADAVTQGDNRVIDLMGDWYFHAYKEYDPEAFTKEDMDDIAFVSALDITQWDKVQPGIDWWGADFAASLQGNPYYAGFAWYARTFEIPEGFDDSGLMVAAGMFDEADEVYINGTFIGSIGFDAQGGNYDGSNPWDVNRLYTLPQGVLKAGTNYIFVRTCNSSGGGGWYTGPIGLYSAGAYNQKQGLPSGEVDAQTKANVLALADALNQAVAQGDLAAYLDRVSPDYFDSGATRTVLGERAMELIAHGAVITDENAAVFGTQTEDGVPLYMYQADRTIKDAEGKEEKLPVSLYFADVQGELKLYGAHGRVYTDTTFSPALGAIGTYHVYLPEGYFDSDERYPVVYMLHGFGSTGLSFRIAGVPAQLDAGMAEGVIRKAIVVFPDDGNKYSWWRDAFATWATDELISRIDGTLRTIPDRRFRVIGGESMGGGGAYNLLLSRGDLYSGIIDIYGAISYSGALQMAAGASPAYMAQFTHYMYSGNHDSYTFDTATASLARMLRAGGVPYTFFVDNGEHSSAFYLPFIKEAFAHALNDLPKTEGADALVKGDITLAAPQPEGGVKVSCTLDMQAAAALCDSVLPNMMSAEASALPLAIPVTLRLIREADGAALYETTQRFDVSAIEGGQAQWEIEIPAAYCAPGTACSLTLTAAVLDQALTLDSATVQ